MVYHLIRIAITSFCLQFGFSVANDCSYCLAREEPSGWVATDPMVVPCQCIDGQCVAPWHAPPHHPYPCSLNVSHRTEYLYTCNRPTCNESETSTTTTTSQSPLGSGDGTCTSTKTQIWNSIGAGGRIFLVDEAYAPLPGWDMRIMCLAKGSSGKLMDPYMETKLHNSMFWQFSKMACMAEGWGIPSGKTFAPMCDKQTGTPETAACEYPVTALSAASKWNVNYTGLALRHWPQQSGWYGPQMTIAEVNGINVRDTHADDTIQHEVVQGVTGASSCYYATGGSDAGDGYATEDERVREQRLTLYQGGVMGTVRRGSGLLTIRSFHFADDAAKESAMAVASATVNPGLQYAKTYVGRNGCDVEIVVEFQPAAGGGLSLSALIDLESLARETEAALRYSVKAYLTPDEVIILASWKQIREGQFVQYNDTCEPGDAEIIRFARTFVCKATGERHRADIAFERADGRRVNDISSDASDPTTFQTEPPSPIEYHEDGTTRRIPTIHFALTTAQVPSSCEAVYWDPLLTSVTFEPATAATAASSTAATTGGAAASSTAATAATTTEPTSATSTANASSSLFFMLCVLLARIISMDALLW